MYEVEKECPTERPHGETKSSRTTVLGKGVARDREAAVLCSALPLRSLGPFTELVSQEGQGRGKGRASNSAWEEPAMEDQAWESLEKELRRCVWA